MKKIDWPVLVLFAAAAAALRAWQRATGFDEAGLAIPGNLPGMLLPLVLAAAAVYFCLAARRLPAQRDVNGEIADFFLFQDMTAVTGGVAGSFLLLACAGASVMGYGTARFKPFAAFAVAAAFSLLYMVFALYRGNAVQSVVLLVPACAMVVYLIFLYRTDAADPVLMAIYVQILAISAMTLSALELAAFAFHGGAPRVFLPVSALALILSLAAAAERQSMASVLLFMGCAFLELGFLAAADFRN